MPGARREQALLTPSGSVGTAHWQSPSRAAVCASGFPGRSTIDGARAGNKSGANRCAVQSATRRAFARCEALTGARHQSARLPVKLRRLLQTFQKESRLSAYKSSRVSPNNSKQNLCPVYLGRRRNHLALGVNAPYQKE